jgi:hypothetical protein
LPVRLEVFSVVDYPNCQKVLFKGYSSDKMGKIFGQIGKMGEKNFNQMRKFIRKCVRISIKSADFRTKRAGVLKWVFENV